MASITKNEHKSYGMGLHDEVLTGRTQQTFFNPEEGENYFRIVGRKQEIINVGGEKVTPSEVESTLLEIPEIDDCLVYAESNAITGQIVATEIVLKANCDPKTLKRAIKNYCRSKLSAYKIPVKIYFKEATNISSRYKKMRLKES